MLSLYEDKWMILIIAVIVFCFSAAYLLVKPYQYESNVLIQIENKAGNLGEFDSLPKLFDMKASPSDVQKALIDSRFVLEPVVERLNLNISIQPHYFPFIGAFIAQHFTSQLTKPWLGFSRFAWGGEKISVKQLEVPHRYLNKNLTVVAGDKGNYQLFGPERNLILTGNVGEVAKAGFNQNTPVTILISSLVANHGTRFTLKRNSTSAIVDQLQKKLSIHEAGSSNQLNIKTGILELSLTGSSPNN